MNMQLVPLDYNLGIATEDQQKHIECVYEYTLIADEKTNQYNAWMRTVSVPYVTLHDEIGMATGAYVPSPWEDHPRVHERRTSYSPRFGSLSFGGSQ